MRRLRWGLVLALATALWLVCLPALAQEGGTALLGQRITLVSGEVQQGDLVLLGGEIEMQAGSRIVGDLAVIGGSARLSGEVTGSVSVLGGSLSLEQSALVRGDVVIAGTLRYRHPDAVVMGNVLEGFDSATRLEQMPDAWSRWAAPNWSAGIDQLQATPAQRQKGGLGALGAVILAMVVAAAAMAAIPDNVRHTRQVMVSSAPLSVGVGILTLLACAVLIPVLVVICIGIPVAAVLGLALLVCMALAWVAVGHLVGEKVLGWLKTEQSPLVEALVGTLLITVLANIPCLGPIAAALAACWGVGAVVLTRFGTRIDPIWSLNTATPAPASKGAPPETEPSEATPPVDSHITQPGTHPLDESLLDDLEADARDHLRDL